MRANLVGFGRMGQNHYRAMAAHGLAITTIDPVAEAQYPSQLAAPPAEVVCISTPASVAVDQAEMALKQGAEYILVEKPCATHIEDMERLISTAEQYEAVIGVNYTERSNPGVQMLKSRLPEIGPIRSVEIARVGPAPGRPTAGPVLDLMTHDLDILNYLELHPERITAVGVTDEGAMANFEHADIKLSLVAGYNSPSKVRVLYVLGENGSLRLDYQTQQINGMGGTAVEPLPLTWRALLEGEPYADLYDGLNALSDALRINAAS